MTSSKSKEVPLPSARSVQSKEAAQDITSTWDALYQTKAALRHIENKLEVAPTSTAVFDPVMDTKKLPASATRKISRKDGRYLDDPWGTAPASKASKSRKEKSRSPLRATTLESNVRKSNRVEFREPLASYREIHGPPSSGSPNPVELKHGCCVGACKDVGEAGHRARGSREEWPGRGCDVDSAHPSVLHDTVIHFLNDRPAIAALQNPEGATGLAALTRAEEDGPARALGSENGAKAAGCNGVPDAESKGQRLADSSPSSTSTASSQRLELLKRRQHDVKLERLKERIRKQWEHSEGVGGQGLNLRRLDHPVMLVNVDSSVTAKVRKVATAPPAPIYRGFNTSETKIRTPDGKVWQEAEFQSLSRELCRDLARHLADDVSVKDKPAERNKEKKIVKPVRKVQKVAQFSSSECRAGSSRLISTSSWRDGQKLVKKILGPVPRMDQRERRTASSDRGGRDSALTPGATLGRADSEPRLDVAPRRLPRSTERARSRPRAESSTRKAAPALADSQQEDTVALNADFLPDAIRGILDDLQLESAAQVPGPDPGGDAPNQAAAAPALALRSQSPGKRKPDKVAAGDEPPVTSKKRHYDSDEVRQYIVRQQEERKRKQSEEKRAQKEATEQKNKRLQELYRKQREAFAKGRAAPPEQAPASRRLQDTYSRLLLGKGPLEEAARTQAGADTQVRPGYQPSGESDKENKVQERPPSASSSSDMSLSEPPQLLTRRDVVESTWVQPDRLSPRGLQPQPQAPPLTSVAGSLLSQLLNLEHVGISHQELESIFPARKTPNMASGPLTFLPQPYVTSPAALTDALPKPSASQYKSKLDRIEALKLTAASLSSRIESEAKKLAGANINYGSVWNSDPDVHPPPHEAGPWAKPLSPPVKEDAEDIFSARIQKMLGTCVSHATFDDDLPGVGNLSEFKKLPEMIRPHSAISNFRIRSPTPKAEGLLAQLCKRSADSSGSEVPTSSQDKTRRSLGSSTESVSEGLLLSEGCLSEEEGSPPGWPPLKVAEILKEKEFCAGERNAYDPIKEFQKEAEKFLPLFGQLAGKSSPGPWEELAKGSPHSVINIFTKSYQFHGKGLEDRLERGASVSRPEHAAASPPSSASYEDDFISSSGNETLTDRKSTLEPNVGSSLGVPEEHSSRKSAYDPSSLDLTSLPSSGAPSAASSRSSSSKGKKVKKEKTEWRESLSGSVPSSVPAEERLHSGAERGSPRRSKSGAGSRVSSRGHEQAPDSDNTLEELSRHALSVSSDKGRSQKTPTSPLSPSSQKLLQFDLPGTSLERSRSSVLVPSASAGLGPAAAFPDLAGSRAASEKVPSPGSQRFSPASLQHRMAAELSYLSAIEESVRHLADVERVRGVSLAQQESVSLAQIIKAQQQRHERDLALLKLKAEQEALACQRQLEETRSRATQAHSESLQQVVRSQREAAEVLQEATSKMAAQQTETARLTTDAARHICEMAELTRTHIAGAISASGAPLAVLYDHPRHHPSDIARQLRARVETERKNQSVSLAQSKEDTFDSKHPKFDSYSESHRYKHHDRRSSSDSSRQDSPSALSSRDSEQKRHAEKLESSIEEQAPTAVDDSLQSDSVPSLPEEKDSTSIATEYSLKFDESMTEDEIEEKSFRSLLPSESHRRFNMEKKRGQHDDSDEETSPEKTTPSSSKELSMPFSGGQDSFSKFTMEMVRQYMKEEEMRAAHQSSLLRLREKALKEKTKAELAWLEHQKKHLRDKGEDDKMPPLRKKQRGLLLRLQQEKAEIKRLQEASKAARKERQLILKQQEEIERIRQTTMKLQEKLKSAGDKKLDSPSDEDLRDNKEASPGPTDLETRSLSPLSISSSETSSIMQKLKKMRSHMDEKHCSPVHYFFSVFTSHHWASLSVCFPNLHPKFQLYIYNQLVRFLTKREQKLMQRRQHAEELLEWKRRLDAEEAEIRQMEKQALAAWDTEMLKTKAPKEDQRAERKDAVSAAESHSESSVPEELGSSAGFPPSESTAAQQHRSSAPSSLAEDLVFSQELESSASPSKHSPPKSCTSVSKQESSRGSHRSGSQGRLPTRSHQHSPSWSDESLSVTQSETASDQSDIEGRIRALKDELRKRKSVVEQLKQEQKKRQKERLRAQEASLIKQLESYDEFIKKTEAELNRDLETSPTAKPQIKTFSTTSDKPKIKPLPLHRSETAKTWKPLTESERSRGSLGSVSEQIDVAGADTERSSSEKSLSISAKRMFELDGRTEEHFQTSSPILRSSRKTRADSGASLENVPEVPRLKDLNVPSRILDVSDVKAEEASSQKSDLPDVGLGGSEESTAGSTRSKPSEESGVLVKLDTKQGHSPTVLPKEDLPLESPDIQSNLIRLAVGRLHQKEPKDGMDQGPGIRSERDREERDLPFSEHLFAPRETSSYSEEFEASSLKKETATGSCGGDVAASPVLALHRDSPSCREQSPSTRSSGSSATSFGSDEEISECLSGKSPSVHSSVHSGRLLELKSPTELMKSEERSDVGHGPEVTGPLALAKDSVPDELLGLHLGDRVLIGNVQPGTLRFKGQTSFAEGFWAGVELDKPEGNNNGTYNGIVYFVCKEKHGIFAPPQKISRLPESLDDDNAGEQEEEDAYSEEQERYGSEGEKAEEGPQLEREKDAVEALYEKFLPRTHEADGSGDKSLKTEPGSGQGVLLGLDAGVHQEPPVTSLTSSKESRDLLSDGLSAGDETLDRTFSEELSERLTGQEPGPAAAVSEKPPTPLLDLLAREKAHLEAQIQSSSQQQVETVSLLTESLLEVFVQDTVRQLQQIHKARQGKIQLSNQELLEDEQRRAPSPDRTPSVDTRPPAVTDCYLRSELEDEKEEVSSPDLYPRPESPVFGASGQEELAKRLAELEVSREFLSVLGDDQDWFEEDFGLSSPHKIQKNKAEETIVPLMAEAKRAAPQACEVLLAVPHTAQEVELLVHGAAEELWKRREAGDALHTISVPAKLLGGTSNGLDLESTSKRVYKQAVFDLTREIFEEIFAEDPNLNQPVWMKPSRVNSSYFRRVKNPNSLDEIKNFIATEVLKLFSLKKEPNHKTDWQKMMKFGRKKRDRVDHILVQELHEEEAQWVNYDEDELCVKMQLAEGIFESLLRDTVDVLNRISDRQGRALLM
ncbi:centrosome-associated protein 350 isoform X2 [Sorex araneus]|uniref:centrosome-associated protein 350 isoform X2 n=1 Tax=Sorex araneus TaxID=42254 RepID=UPI002433FB13|nr:centrosome-associated protein 350 isoform X2 [Sorex araneus]